ncbi:sulfite oxidase-like oxidoreductase [Devosia nitrariae]|uniref:Sulfite oxidase-like oxidoreductase n=1 Tax=Devosia nitrariae TaxID=2071872 RepID=A0ABQ5WD78_9HYPH|nr:sulfite oxidase-like oxidoreductase [Devosia nitrariae]GLQ57668.1 sulfite oxidase-like oxidoreductase [Devosia nitrariae]
MTDDDDPALPPDSKLTRTKADWVRQGRFLTGRNARPETERLPPGQHLVKNWPILDLGVEPAIDRTNWRLDIVGSVATDLSWDWAEFARQPQVELVSDIHCVTSWSRYDNTWSGTPTGHLLEAAGVLEEARFVILHSYDGYTTNLTIEDFFSPDALLAYSWQGEQLSREHGGPVRLVVPHLYFWKSAKWLRRIEFSPVDAPGFWEVRGYHNHGDPWTEERYS